MPLASQGKALGIAAPQSDPAQALLIIDESANVEQWYAWNTAPLDSTLRITPAGIALRR